MEYPQKNSGPCTYLLRKRMRFNLNVQSNYGSFYHLLCRCASLSTLKFFACKHFIKNKHFTHNLIKNVVYVPDDKITNQQPNCEPLKTKTVSSVRYCFRKGADKCSEIAWAMLKNLVRKKGRIFEKRPME